MQFESEICFSMKRAAFSYYCNSTSHLIVLTSQVKKPLSVGVSVCNLDILLEMNLFCLFRWLCIGVRYVVHSFGSYICIVLFHVLDTVITTTFALR